MKKKVAIFEVCRSPEIKKETEAVILSQVFNTLGIDYDLYSNDQCWPEQFSVDKLFIKQQVSKIDVGIVHLAVHGENGFLCLKWTEEVNVRDRTPSTILTGEEIKTMAEFSGKLIVSGACHSASLMKAFLDAGATAVIAPDAPIGWLNLGNFFSTFYRLLFSGQNASAALDSAIKQFPEYASYRILSK